ncbi:Wound-induced protein 1 [Spatholobus suberectus]|nr:Wound-induced protein 1 [Spatholobus suberectus]
MRRLTDDSAAAADTFRFVLQSIASFGSTVIVEGCDTARPIAWLHAWTVTDGIIT